MKKLVLLAAVLCAALPALAADTGVLKLSLWDKTAIATPANTQEITGIDFGIGSNSATVTGVQLDLLFAQTQYELNGVSMAWVISMANEVRGAQLAMLTKSEMMQGAQLGLVNMNRQELTGLQFGFFNQAEYIKGLQLGFVNYAKTIDGLQVGILNIAENGWFPAMVIVNGRF
ncbi:MAG: hypothetical protein PUK24_05680 [Elusimicrobia bacterium]|nr:hypothetical protein [Elusimicrobiota bacterium]MDD7579015.1 hypothetical protein [Elusimicrobiota bacterium]MDY6039953.1 hypothetical protein [Elusimicrobiaceae bacterium]